MPGRCNSCNLTAAFLLLLCMVPATVSSSMVALDSGTNWLAERQNEDGSFASSASVAAHLQGEAAAEAALIERDAAAFAAGPAVREALARRTDDNTEFLALAVRQAAAHGEQPMERLDALLERQNRDGGFAEAAGHPSTVQATAFALQALHAAGHSADDSVQRAIAYLADLQQPDGSWNQLTGVSDIYTTALATRALSRYAPTFGLAAELGAAAEFLTQQRRGDGGYDTSWETAHAVLALLPVTNDPSNFAPAIDWLLDSQRSDGSWEEDIYATGLALRALAAASRLGDISDDSDTGLVAGRLVNEADGTPIPHGEIVVEGAPHLSALADGEGTFELALPADDTTTLLFEAAGFAEASQSVQVAGGDHVDLGLIRLEPLPDIGRLGGIVTDRDSGAGIRGAVVSISGAAELQVPVDSEGRYYIDLEHGSYTVSVDASGYYGVVASFGLESGRNLTFSPALTPATGDPPADEPVNVAGRIVASDTGDPIAGASAASGDTEVTTDVDGRFLLEHLDPGERTFTITAVGYAGAILSVTLPPAESLDLGTIALDSVEEPEVTLTGIVADAVTGDPLPGAAVRAHGHSAWADATGRYTLADLAVGTIDLTAEADGYHSRSIPIETQSGGTLEVPIALEPGDRGGLQLSSLRTDAATYEAHREVELEVDLENTGSDDLVARLYLAVFDSNGERVSEAPATSALIDGDADADALQQALEESRIGLEPGEALTESFSWFTQARPPGTYELRVRAYQASDGALLGERSQGIQIEPTRRVELVSVRPDPLYLLQGVTDDLGFTVLLQHHSNENFSLEGAFDLLHPDGHVLRSESFSANLTPNETNHRIDMPGEPFTAEVPGEHEITIHPIQGADPLTVHGQPLFAAPGTRLEIHQERAPGVVPPDGDHRIDIEIRLEGKEQ